MDTPIETAIELKAEYANVNGGEPIALDTVRTMVELGIKDHVVRTYGDEVYSVFRVLKAA